MKQFRGYVIIAIVILVIYAALAFWLDHETAQQHETEFNEQQALQTRLSAQSIEEHFAWIMREMNVAAAYFIPQILQGGLSVGAIDILSRASAFELYPKEELALAFFAAPDQAATTFYIQPGDPGSRGNRLLTEWASAYWDTVQSSGEPYVTPFDVSPEGQYYGLLLPVYHDNTLAGILGLALDFGPILESYVIPIRSGQYGAAWVQDATSLVIYDHETEIIGQYVSSIAQPYPDLQRINQRLMAENSGQGEYHFTTQREGKVVRKLVAWSTAHLGSQRLTIALSAPETEINASLTTSREQTMLLGMLLGVTLIASGGLFYSLRQRTLQQEVTLRTQELEQLTADLEQRVARRTHQLDQERAQLRTILEAMDDGLLYRQETQFLYANSALSRLLGYSNEEFLSQSLEIIRHVTSAVDPALMADAREHHALPGDQHPVWRQEVKLTRKDGSLFDASVFMATVRDRHNQPIGTVQIIRDISREKALQAQRDRFITNAAHELRRPLTNLKTRLYLLSRQPDKLHEHAEILQKATDDMADLVQDLVDMAQIASQELHLNRRDIVLQHVLRSALDIQQGHAYRVRVQILNELPDLPIHAHADYQRLTQTFNNLIAHAIHSTAPDGSVAVRLYTQSDRAIIEIDDDGPIIEPEQLMFIFEPFFQPSEGNVQRTGMGLALARQIIEQHGGQITAQRDSENNRFTVRLPFRSQYN